MASLYLQFAPDFPAHTAGDLIELAPTDEQDRYYLVGKLKYCDLRLLPPENKSNIFEYNTISRIQFTLKYESRTNLWLIMDGGVYLTEKDTYPGQIAPSANGVWLNDERLTPNDWATLSIGDKLYLGGRKKIVIKGSFYDTVNDEIWESSHWRCGDYRDTGIPVAESKELAKHASSNVTTPWGLLEKVFTWVISPSKTKQEQFMKMLLLSSGIAIAFSTEVRELIRWIFNR